jgi:hypothetical protein
VSPIGCTIGTDPDPALPCPPPHATLVLLGCSSSLLTGPPSTLPCLVQPVLHQQTGILSLLCLKPCCSAHLIGVKKQCFSKNLPCSLPSLLSPIHVALLPTPATLLSVILPAGQVHSYPRIFALAVPPTWMALPQVSSSCSSTLFNCLLRGLP